MAVMSLIGSLKPKLILSGIKSHGIKSCCFVVAAAILWTIALSACSIQPMTKSQWSDDTVMFLLKKEDVILIILIYSSFEPHLLTFVFFSGFYIHIDTLSTSGCPLLTCYCTVTLAISTVYVSICMRYGHDE